MSLETIFFTGFALLAAMVALPCIAWWLYLWVRETSRRRAVRAMADRCGYDFRGWAPGKLEELSQFRLFANDSILLRRSGRRIRNLFTHKSDELVVTGFDYQWKSCDDGDGFDPRVRRTVIHVTCGRLRMPEFDVRSNGPYLRLTSRFRSKVKIDGHAAFARRYDLSGPDEARIRELFHDDVLELIAAEPRKLQFQGMDNGFVFFPVDQTFFGEGRLKAEDLPQLMRFALTLGGEFLRTNLSAQTTAQPAATTAVAP